MMKKLEKNLYSLSVHEFVDIVTIGGSLSSGALSPKRALDGIKAHQMRQSEVVSSVEVPLEYQLEGVRAILRINGRADIIDTSQDIDVIEEIKSTYGKIEEIQKSKIQHLIQGKCYAAMYLLQNNLDMIGVRITYIKFPEGVSRFLNYQYNKDEILDWFYDECEKILDKIEEKITHELKRNESIMKVAFPYKEYRLGQKEMAEKVFTTIKNAEKAFMQAPTGIGKTMASIFPALKTMAYSYSEKIFYLTAKSIVKAIAKESIDALRNNGLYLRSITMNSKDSMCCNNPQICHPAICQYANGYYDRQPMALKKLKNNIHYDMQNITKLAKQFNICPFELSLDISLECDMIICDYNHAYDPRAKIKRFFAEGGDYVILADEAHNLVNRARDMFSQSISKDDIMTLKRKAPATQNNDEIALFESLNAINKYFIAQKKAMHANNIQYEILSASPEDFDCLINDFVDAALPLLDFTLRGSYAKELVDIYYQLKAYLYTLANIDECYYPYVKIEGNNIYYKLFCVDPSKRLQECHDKIRSTSFFSASLTPFDYFTRLLCADDIFDTLALPSPFPKENLKMIISTHLPTVYKARGRSAQNLAKAIYSFAKSKDGNYIIFFPSYAYMEMVHNIFISLHNDIFSPMQTRGMNDDQRNAFISLFDNEDEMMVAFAVMGGIFSEGIDLSGERLIGAVIVGTALPMINFEGNLIKAYHEKLDENGFSYAYMFPGFNKVLQSVGRIIRSSDDVGAALLVDIRFSKSQYGDLMPYWWKPIEKLSTTEDIEDTMEVFWNKLIK